MWRQYICCIHAIFQQTVWQIRMFFSLKHFASQGESSLKISARWGSPFRRSQGTNIQTNRLTHWHPIAFIEWLLNFKFHLVKYFTLSCFNFISCKLNSLFCIVHTTPLSLVIYLHLEISQKLLGNGKCLKLMVILVYHDMPWRFQKR